MKEETISRPGNTNRRGWLKGAATLGFVAAAGAIPTYSLAQEGPLVPPPPVPVQERVSPRITGPTTYANFSGVDFQPYTANAYTIAGFCGIYPTSASGYFAAKLNLPQRCVVTNAQVSVLNNVSGGTQSFYLIVTSLSASGGGGSYFSKVDINTVSANLQTLSTTTTYLPYLIDNTFHSFYLLWIPSGASANQILYGARVGYAGGLGHFGPGN